MYWHFASFLLRVVINLPVKLRGDKVDHVICHRIDREYLDYWGVRPNSSSADEDGAAEHTGDLVLRGEAYLLLNSVDLAKMIREIPR
jgi:hypothetical protein